MARGSKTGCEMIYTGIGSRNTPNDILEAMTVVGSFMNLGSMSLDEANDGISEILGV